MYLKDIKAWTAILAVSLPASVYAGQSVGRFGADELLEDAVVIAIVAVFALAGGIGAMFIRTDADEFVLHPKFAKVFIGFWLGVAVGLAIFNWYNISVYLLLVPVIISSSLGSAILVFYMRWFSDPKTSRKFKDKIEQKLGIEDEGA